MMRVRLCCGFPIAVFFLLPFALSACATNLASVPPSAHTAEQAIVTPTSVTPTVFPPISVSDSWRNLSFFEAGLTIKYPEDWEVTSTLEDRVGFLSPNAEMFVFHWYIYGLSVTEILDARENDPDAWNSAIQGMEEYSRNWVLSNDWQIVHEDPIKEIRTNNQRMICKNGIYKLQLSQERILRMLVCEFDCASYICGVNYGHFGGNPFTQGEMDVINKFVDNVHFD